MVVVVVSDTSPVRALAHLRLLELLDDLFDRVLVPPAVADELLRPPRRFAPIDVGTIPFIAVQAPTGPTPAVAEVGELHAGESEALTLAAEVDADALLIDERAGREVARRMGVATLGTLGILLAAKERGSVTAVRALIDSLSAELGFFVGEPLRREVLRRAGELPAED